MNFGIVILQLNQKFFTKIQQTLPDHLQDLFKRSCTRITLYQSVKLANLLGEFATSFLEK